MTTCIQKKNKISDSHFAPSPCSGGDLDRAGDLLGDRGVGDVVAAFTSCCGTTGSLCRRDGVDCCSDCTRKVRGRERAPAAVSRSWTHSSDRQ